MLRKFNNVFLGTALRISKPRIFTKLLTIVLTMCIVHVFANNPNQKLTFSLKDASLKQVFTEIQKQTKYDYLINQKLLAKINHIDLSVEDMDLNTVLHRCLEPHNLTFEIKDKTIFIREKVTIKDKKESSSSSLLQAFRGTVTDTDGNPLSGVTVTVRGTSMATSTDELGTFTLTSVGLNQIIDVALLGYRSVEMEIGSFNPINIVMESSIQGLDEVVVVGYGTQKKTTLTGSVASVSGANIAKNPVTNVSNALAGLLPGVVTKNTSGEPGRDNSLLLIRGQNTTGNTSPLVVVDGVQGAVGWERINSNDIESISVLKDASAAIYGAAAANGVILITTKRGVSGKTVVNYTFNQGISQPTRLPKMANSYEFGQYVNQLDVEAGNSPRYTEEMLQKYKDGSDPNYISEDWYTTSLKKNVLSSQHNLNLRGGNEKVKYSVSGSYSGQDGIFKKTNLSYETYTLRSNLDVKVNEWLKVGVDLNGTLLDGTYPGGGSNFAFLKQIPFVPVYWPNGLPSAGIEAGQNPVIQASAESGYEKTTNNHYLAKGSYDITIPFVKGLGVDGYMVYQRNVDLNKHWQKPWTVYDYDSTTDTYLPKLGGGITSPQLGQTFNGSSSTLINFRVKYNTKINDHSLNTFVAMEKSSGLSNNFWAFRKDYISDQIDELFAGSLGDQWTDGSRAESSSQNYFGRVSYDYLEKYLVDLTFRFDGSSAFPKGKQWGFFPSAAVAWRISEEGFFKDKFSYVDNLKLRGSYGQMGNDAIEPFQHLRRYTVNNQGMLFGQNPQLTQGLVAGVSPNPNITWEVATSANIGLDASLFNGGLGLVFDVFHQKRENILAPRSLAIPIYAGLELPDENIGVVTNKGLELELSHAKSKGDFSYRVAGNVAYARNRIDFIDEPTNVPDWQRAEGHILGAENYYKAIGIIRTQEQLESVVQYPGSQIGDLYYEDIDENGVIDSRDMVRTDKSNIPEINFGANVSLNYKNFGMWMSFAGSTNYWQYYHVNARIAISQLQDVIVNRYTPGSMDSKYPRLPTQHTDTEVNGLNSTFWLMNASYMKLKTLEFSYTLPDEVISKLRLAGARVFVNGNNLFTIDNLKWNDPENSSSSNSNYPQQRIFNLGVNISF